MSRRLWLWRWRRNPLRRRSYVVEAWALLVVGLLTVACASFTAVSVTHEARQHLDRQRFERHATAAVLTEDAADRPGYAAAPLARVRWIAPDGTRHTGRAKVDLGLRRGAVVRVWTDDDGALVPPPLSGPAARTESLVTGGAAAFGVCLVAMAAWGLAEQVADRRRAERWGREWTVVGPQWDHRTA